MAESRNNLKAVLEDTANAIRSKIGSASNIIPRFFADIISSLPNQEVVNQLFSGTLVNVVIPDDVSTLRTFTFTDMTSLQSVDFNEITTIPYFCCSGCENLINVILNENTTRIEHYSFRNCYKIDNLILPHNITYIGNEAFNSCGNHYEIGTHTFEFISNNNIEISIGEYAFQYSHLSKFIGVVNECGYYAFSGCTSLNYVDIQFNNCNLNGSVFGGCQNIQYFNIKPSSSITSLNSAVFSGLAQNTYQTATINPFDFRNSTFTSLPADVWNSCKFDGIVYFPTTLSSISGNFLNNAIGNWTLYFNSIPTVSSSSFLRNNDTNFIVKYCFQYNYLENARISTNWTLHTSQMLGFGTGFTAGSTLPAITTGGNTLTWYSDINLTTQITTSSSADDTYYCTIS